MALPVSFIELGKRIGEIATKAKEGKRLSQADQKLIDRIDRMFKPGRPLEGSQELPTYNSQRECFNATGIPEAVQAEAKKRGCPAFRHNRVYLGPLLKDLFEAKAKPAPTDPASMAPRTQKDLFSAKREEIKYKIDAGLVVNKDEVQDGLRRAVAEFYGALDRVFCTELPPLLVGAKDERAIRSKCKEEIEEMKADLKQKFEALGQDEKP